MVVWLVTIAVGLRAGDAGNGELGNRQPFENSFDFRYTTRTQISYGCTCV